jgi:hypothetical protein
MTFFDLVVLGCLTFQHPIQVKVDYGSYSKTIETSDGLVLLKQIPLNPGKHLIVTVSLSLPDGSWAFLDSKDTTVVNTQDMTIQTDCDASNIQVLLKSLNRK